MAEIEPKFLVVNIKHLKDVKTKNDKCNYAVNMLYNAYMNFYELYNETYGKEYPEYFSINMDEPYFEDIKKTVFDYEDLKNDKNNK